MIRTFIFFDLETTGILTKKSMPRITELSLIAVSRDEICNTTEDLPRVLHKLVLPVNPMIQIPDVVQKLTGLTNENNKEVQSFECETYNIISSFLQRLAVPICFVAHNGNRFDYPILLHEFQNVNKDFRDDILSIDTLHLFKAFFSTSSQLSQEDYVEVTAATSLSSMDVNVLMDDGYDEILCAALDSVMAKDFINTYEDEIVSSKKPVSSSSEVPMVQSELTMNTPHVSCYKKIQEINEKTPESQIIKAEALKRNVKNSERASARRRLDFTSEQPCNFKLSTIYQHIFKSKPDNVHSAEGDCLTMLRCACQLGSFFVEWADRNALPLVSYKWK